MRISPHDPHFRDVDAHIDLQDAWTDDHAVCLSALVGRYRQGVPNGVQPTWQLGTAFLKNVRAHAHTPACLKRDCIVNRRLTMRIVVLGVFVRGRQQMDSLVEQSHRLCTRGTERGCRNNLNSVVLYSRQIEISRSSKLEISDGVCSLHTSTIALA